GRSLHDQHGHAVVGGSAPARHGRCACRCCARAPPFHRRHSASHRNTTRSGGSSWRSGSPFSLGSTPFATSSTLHGVPSTATSPPEGVTALSSLESRRSMSLVTEASHFALMLQQGAPRGRRAAPRSQRSQ